MSNPSPPDATIVQLLDRGIVAVGGEDAGRLLQGIITNDIGLLAHQSAMPAGLLSPQGKVLFEFLVVKTADGMLLDVARDKAAELVKRLAMYRLRAKAVIENRSDTVQVWAALGVATAAAPAGGAAFPDPRSPDLGWRIVAPGAASVVAVLQPAKTGVLGDYDARRIALGVPEGGKDWDFGDAFAHEADFDLFAGVSFEKGCYVGQEIVARMQHRGTVRKRVVKVRGAAMLPSDRPDVMVGDVVIGRLGSVAGTQALAVLRLDRAIEAIDKAEVISAGGIALDVDAEMVARQRAVMAQRATHA